MEHEAKEPAAVTRGQNAMYLLPHDPAAGDDFLGPVIQRIDGADGALQLLVIASDAETAGWLAASAVRLGDERLRVVPIANMRRAERRVREGAQVIIGTASDLLALVRGATLKLESVRAVVVAWADALSTADVDALEALFAELPKAGARVIVASEETPAVGALIERYARRPRRAASRSGGDAPAVTVGFVTTAAAGRAAALRRVIDGLDPATARVVVRSEDSDRTARQALAAMGYHGAHAPMAVVRAGDSSGDPVDLAILFDIPPTTEALAEAASGAQRVVALVQPRQVAGLRALAGGGGVTPVTLPDVAARGEAEVAALRTALLNELRAGGVGREHLVLEPLLEEYDAFDLAAAALRLVGRSTAGATQVARAGAHAPPPGAMTRVFVNVGEMDNARPGDLVGAIINEGGLQRDQVGRVELRDKHAVVEVASDVAEQVIERLSGVSIRGRRVQARLDQDRPIRRERGADEPTSRPPRAPRGEDRGGSRPPARERSFDRERPPRERSFDRERPPRERSFDRERPPRERSFDRDRPPRERSFGKRPGDSGARDRAPRSGGRPPRPRRGE